MLSSGPRAHISSNFAENILNRHGFETIHCSEVNTCDAIQRLRQVEMWLVLASFSFTRIGWWCSRFIRYVEFLVQRFQLCITILQLLIIEVIEFQRLLQCK